jgi:hypothetical protein
MGKLIMRIKFLNTLFKKERNPFKRKQIKPLPPIHFASISHTTVTPSNNQIAKNDFFLVRHKKKDYWALFQCPCGCGEVISLSLQKIHANYWRVYKSKNNRPSLSPSVWQSEGCCSHFILTDGRIYWCENTGRVPYLYSES